MSQYAYVPGDVIIGTPGPLPKEWITTSGFDTLSDAELLPYGFRPVVGNPPTDDPRTNTIVETLTVEPTQVVATYTVTPKTADEVVAYDKANSPIPVLSSSQMLFGLAHEGLITADEALAAATSGAVPASIQAVFNTLTGSVQMLARIRWARANEIIRTDPIIAQLASSVNWSADQTDDFFYKYSVI